MSGKIGVIKKGIKKGQREIFLISRFYRRYEDEP